MGLGLEWVSSERRVPYPPARITAFTTVHNPYDRQPYRMAGLWSWCDDGMSCGSPIRQYGPIESLHCTPVRVEATSLSGTYRIRPEVHEDDRGEFWRSFCRQELAEHGLEFNVSQSNVSVNPRQYTLRGFHYQQRPSTEQKFLTVMAGALHIVIVDIRRDSSTFLAHESFHFDVGDRSSLLVPEGCATGFLTLVDGTTVQYQMSDHYQQEYYAGFRYDDPHIGVEWPADPAIVSDRDRGFANLDPSAL